MSASKKKKETAKFHKEKSHPMTREGFFKILRKVTKPVPKPPDQEKSKQEQSKEEGEAKLLASLKGRRGTS